MKTMNLEEFSDWIAICLSMALNKESTVAAGLTKVIEHQDGLEYENYPECLIGLSWDDLPILEELSPEVQRRILLNLLQQHDISRKISKESQELREAVIKEMEANNGEETL